VPSGTEKTPERPIYIPTTGLMPSPPGYRVPTYLPALREQDRLEPAESPIEAETPPIPEKQV